ncbi:MAG: hypothetical protein COB26_01165 [Piscirickettsiaceae bacterium]|nr:MAG: hypothetical protein COB26_01165 [Piscirickettsiaceae bacterium]
MFTHLLQIASFKSRPQNFTTPAWIIVITMLLFTGVQGYALSLSPGNELIRMLVASLLKIVVIAGLLLGWMRSIKAAPHFNSLLLVIVLTSLFAEIVKLPLTTMIRDAKLTSDVTFAAILSIPLLAVIIWQYSVWYYSLKQVSERSKGEIVTVMITLVLISEVVGFVLSKIGSPVEGF